MRRLDGTINTVYVAAVAFVFGMAVAALTGTVPVMARWIIDTFTVETSKSHLDQQ